ncbi:response regulator [Pleionea sp. CnH1-48]|uniref:response regulator n=1 Tax=Pleionea sp. CnH1-48 TaxID=2954494 RepID=UPI002097D7FF|nr:response regulator [Pleionea sp. CnH1-48]MCO7223493.1 response regulator [Pleionea sp. CnH1-48]
MNQVKPINILLAEDNCDHAELMIDTLKDFNSENSVVHVTNGEQLLEYLRKEQWNNTDGEHKPDLVLLDIKMPRMDGISALREIKSDSKLKSMPVVMVTTSRAQSEIELCFNEGVNSFITKPIQFDEFSRKIRELNLYWVLTTELPGSHI